MMIVQRIQCYHYNEAFNIPFHSPQANRLRADSVIVCIDCGPDGRGWGESAPRPYVSGEDCHSVAALIVDRFAPILLKASIDSRAALQAVLEHLETVCKEMRLTAYNSALGAVDLALLDALERSQRISSHELFPLIQREELRLSLSVPFLPLEVIEKYFPMFQAHVDVSVIKVLVSEDAEETYARVQLLRHLAHPDVELRLEFNGKSSLARVRAYLEHIAPLAPSAVEQPLPSGCFDGLRQLREDYDLNLVADESLVTFEDAERLVQNGAYNIFNIKVSKCGGLLRAMKIAQLAARHGIKCQVGTHVGESKLLGIAGRRLSRSLPNFDCYGGGSEVLFSQFLNLHQGIEGDAWPPAANRDIFTHQNLDALLSECRLLSDTGPTTRNGH
jgi:muconate cycloisomerase